jgi:predicted nucleic acid-binding protein
VSALYLETSVLLAWLLGESEAAGVRERLESAETIVTSDLTWTETERALTRVVARRRMREADAQRVRNAVARTRATTLSMGVTTEVLARAGRAFPKEPVRTLDAIHLATALAFTSVFPDLTVLSLDRRVLDNAETLGL